MFGSGFNVQKLKANAKMAVHRISLLSNKKKNLVENQKREIAAMLREAKDEKARIRVESIIRDDFTMEAFEILQLYCELIAERIRLIETERACPPDMREAVCTLLYAAPRTDVVELNEVAKQLNRKYGKEMVAAASSNADGCVNSRVVDRLSVSPPDPALCQGYLRAIAAEHGVQWEPRDLEFGFGSGSGGGGGVGGASLTTGYSVPAAAASGYAHMAPAPAAQGAGWYAAPGGESGPSFPAPPSGAPGTSASAAPPASAASSTHPSFPQPPSGAPAAPSFPQPPSGAPAAPSFPQPPSGAPAAPSFPQPPSGAPPAPSFPAPPQGTLIGLHSLPLPPPSLPTPSGARPAPGPSQHGPSSSQEPTSADPDGLPDEDDIARRLAALRGGGGGSV